MKIETRKFEIIKIDQVLLLFILVESINLTLSEAYNLY